MDSTDHPSGAGDGAGGGSDEEFFQILTEFEAELRAGNVPSVEEWAERHPEHGDEIRELFPGVLIMECTASSLRSHGASEDIPEGLGPYEIKRVLGRGGMGTVYLAWDPRVGREVALKVLHSSWQSSQKSVDRFIREVKAAGGLRHPNIVPVFGSGQVGGVPYYAMQYVQGVGLDDCIGALAHVHPSGSHSLVSSDVQTLVSVVQGRRGMIPKGPDPDWEAGNQEPSLSWGEISRIIQEVGIALGHAHATGILHRDIKPANVLLDSEGHAWVTDFGLCQLEGDVSMTQDGDVVGTLKYMAPEQLEGAPDEQSDVYSLGLVMYELLTRRSAFPETQRARLVHNILKSEPIRPRRIDPKIPRDLENIVLKATAKDQGQRYSNAQALVRDLQAFDAGRAVKARPPGAFYLLGLFIKRQKALSATILLGAAALALLVVMYTIRLRSEHDRSEFGQYAAQLAAAESGLRAGSISRAQNQLHAAPAKHRGWEWHHLNARLHQSLQGLATSHHYVRDLEFSPDGTFLLAAAEGGTYLYRYGQGAYDEVQVWPGDAFACAFAPDGSAAFTADNRGRTWRLSLVGDMESTEVGSTVFEPQFLECTARSELIAGSIFGQVVALNLTTGESRLVSERGSRIAGAWLEDSGGLRIADSRGWLGTLDGAGRESSIGDLGLGQLKDVAWNPKAAEVIAIDLKGTLHSRSWPSLGLGRTSYGGVDGMSTVRFSPDGSGMAAGGDMGRLHLWNASDGEFAGARAGTPGRIMSCAWREDAALVATGDDLGAIHIWHPRFAGGHLRLGRHWGDVGSFDTVAGRSDALSVSRDGTLIHWDVAVGQAKTLIADPTSAIMDVRFVPGSNVAVALCGSTELMAWDLTTSELLLHTPVGSGVGNRVRGIIMDPKGDRFFIGLREQGADSTHGIEVWRGSDLTQTKVLKCKNESLTALGAPASVDFLVAGTAKGEVILLDPETGGTLSRIALPEGAGVVQGVDVSEDGRWALACDWQAKTYLVDLEEQKPVRVLSLDDDIIHCSVFADGGRRVVAGTRGGQVGVWDPETGVHLSNIDVLDHWVAALHFDEDSQRLFVGGSEGSVEVYDLLGAKERWDGSQSGRSSQQTGLGLRSDLEFSGHALEVAWRELMDGQSRGFESAQRIALFIERDTYHEARLAGLKGALALAKGRRGAARRQLEFALQSTSLDSERRGALRTLLFLASVGSEGGAGSLGGPLDLDPEFLERWKRVIAGLDGE